MISHDIIEFSKVKFEDAMYEIYYAENAQEEGLEEEVIRNHFNKAQELIDEIFDRQMALAGNDILRSVQDDLGFGVQGPADEDQQGNENAQDFKFEKIWKWCYDITLKLNLGYEWDEALRRVNLPERTQL